MIRILASRTWCTKNLLVIRSQTTDTCLGQDVKSIQSILSFLQPCCVYIRRNVSLKTYGLMHRGPNDSCESSLKQKVNNNIKTLQSTHTQKKEKNHLALIFRKKEKLICLCLNFYICKVINMFNKFVLFMLICMFFFTE